MKAILKSIELPGRVTLSYAEQGDPEARPVLFLHGVTDSWRSFEPVLSHLPASIRAIALTQRGHGDSGRPDTGYRTQDFGADIAAVVDVLGLAAPVIVGHSMGATHALRFALDYPGTAAGLVLAGAFATYRDNPAVLDLWGSAISRLQDPVDAAFVRTFQEGTLAQRVPEPFLEMVVEESLKLPARVWRSTFEGFLDDEWTRHYARIGIPTLVLWGRHDALSPRRDQDALCAAISHARLLVYEAAGHALHWEEPARFAADLVSFTRRLHSSVAAPRY